MFKKNTKHQQPALISAVSELPEKQRSRLENSWAGIFYREFFSRMDENVFSVLYSDIPSRPNVAVNVMVGMEALKAGNGWNDAELYDNFCYNLQVRYALGYDRLGDGEFEIRTLYNFRERLSKYNVKEGVNLLEKAFEQITDAQIVDLKVRTGMQRMDSTQIASNIVSASRLQLLVAAIQRVERILSEADKKRLAENFAPYIKDSAGHYTYRVKGTEAVQEHLQKVGESIYAMLSELKTEYATESAYQILERIFTDNFHILERGIQAKGNKELSSGCLQSVDDLEATYRTKGTKHYKGYVANITETCDPENELQLITKVQVAPNNIDDGQMLAEGLSDLKERTALDTLVTDGGYDSKISAIALQSQEVYHIQTAIRGMQPNPNKFSLADFNFQRNKDNKTTTLTCPQGITVPVIQARTTGLQAHFSPIICANCPCLKDGRCRVKPQQREPRYVLAFTSQEVQSAKRRKEYLAHKGNSHNLRSAVEATVRSVKHPFPAGKMPVRGQFRVTSMVIASAVTTNVRRIQRYMIAKTKAAKTSNKGEGRSTSSSDASTSSFFVTVRTYLMHWSVPRLTFFTCFA